MLLSVCLLLVSASLVGAVLACRRSFGAFTESVVALADTTHDIAGRLDEVRDTQDGLLTRCLTCPHAKFPHQPPTLPSDRPYSPGADDIDLPPLTSQSA